MYFVACLTFSNIPSWENLRNRMIISKIVKKFRQTNQATLHINYTSISMYFTNIKLKWTNLIGAFNIYYCSSNKSCMSVGPKVPAHDTCYLCAFILILEFSCSNIYLFFYQIVQPYTKKPFPLSCCSSILLSSMKHKRSNYFATIFS